MKFKIKLKATDITFIVIMLVFFAIIILPAFNSFNPVRVVVSESMVPVLNKGDIIFVVPCKIEDVDVGDIVAYRSKLQNGEVIAHRVVAKEEINATVILTTKGDANTKTDQEYGEDYVTSKNFFGKVLMVDGHIFKIPYVGYLAYGLMRAGTSYSIDKKNVYWISIIFFAVAMLTVSFMDAQNKQKKKRVYIYRNERIRPLHAFLILFISFLLIFLFLHTTVAYSEKTNPYPNQRIFVYNPTEVPMKGVVFLESSGESRALAFSIGPEEIKVMNETYGKVKKAVVYSSFFWIIYPESFVELVSSAGIGGIFLLDIISAAIVAGIAVAFFYILDLLVDFYHYGRYRRILFSGKSLGKSRIIYERDLMIISSSAGIAIGIFTAFFLCGLILIAVLAIILRMHPYLYSSSVSAGFTITVLYVNHLCVTSIPTVFVLVVAIYALIYAYAILFSKNVAEVIFNETV